MTGAVSILFIFCVDFFYSFFKITLTFHKFSILVQKNLHDSFITFSISFFPFFGVNVN